MVIGAGTGIGFAIASRYSERPRQIGQLIACLTTLKSYVNYISMPLPEALEHSGAVVDGPVKELFERTGKLLASDGWLSPRQVLAGVLEEMAEKLVLGLPEREILLQLGANLGTTNRDEQQKYLAMVIAGLEKIEQESRHARDLNVKMFRYLGICAGLALTILLV